MLPKMFIDSYVGSLCWRCPSKVLRYAAKEYRD